MRCREKLKDETMRALLKKRGAIIEPLFGWAKEGMKFRRWTVRGLEKVQTQWSLLCTAMNFRRLHPTLGRWQTAVWMKAKREKSSRRQTQRKLEQIIKT